VDAPEGEHLPVPVAVPMALAPVAEPARGLARGRALASASMPAVQAAAVAAGSFVAGAAVAGLVHRRRSPSLASGARAGRALARGPRKPATSGSDRVQVVGRRTMLLDVYLLGTPDQNG
jgi:hypothetical protein